MAAGFTPKHIEDFPLNDLSKKHFLVLAIEAANKLEWKINYISDIGFIAYTNKGMFAWNAEVKIIIEESIAHINSASTGSEMVDWGKNKKNVLKFLSVLEEIKPSYTPDELDVKYDALKQSLVSEEEDILKLPPASTKDQAKDFLSFFVPTKDFFITPILIDLNIVIFIIMAICGVSILSPDSESLINWGANFKPMTLDGQCWRILTNCFLHIGIFHLLMNMYALLYIGILLEPILGKSRFISAYLLTGITASFTSLWWHDITISAGASGAIFGMYGVFLALLTTDLIEKETRKALLTSITVFVGYNLLYGMKGGIDNAAHIGGLLGGTCIGYAFIPSLKQQENKKLKFTSIAILSTLILAFSTFAYFKIPNDIGTYDQKMKNFVSIESKALEVFNKPKNTPNTEILKEIKENGIYNWNKGIKLIEEVDRLNLPEEIHQRNNKLKKYCNLRIKSYELIYKEVSENTNKYDEEIGSCNKQIEALISELSNDQTTK